MAGGYLLECSGPEQGFRMSVVCVTYPKLEGRPTPPDEGRNEDFEVLTIPKKFNIPREPEKKIR